MNSLKNFLRKIVHAIESLNKWWVFLGCISIVLILGAADYLSGFEFSFSLFYLVPVSITAWLVNRNSALSMAALSAMVWFISNELAGQTYTNPAIGYWNALVRFGFFSIISLLLVYLKKSLQREQELSRSDFLTGILNSRAFYDFLSIEMPRARRYNHPFSLAYIDLDNFKQINDKFGHTAGDEVLKLVAATIQKNLRQTDIVARLGGDEFAIFLPESDAEPAKTSLNKIRAILLNTMVENKMEVTFSIGVITFHEFSISLDEVIHKADELMYSIKGNGKNNIKFAVELAS